MTDAALSMDRMYRRQRHVYDLTRKYYLLGRDRMIDGLDARPGHRVLEIGCGTGRNLIQAARRYPQALIAPLLLQQPGADGQPEPLDAQRIAAMDDAALAP